MKKSNLVKLFSILVMSVMVMMFNTNVLAANDTNGFNQLPLGNNSSSNTNNASGNTNTNQNSTNTNTNSANNTNSTNRNNTTSANNSSIYNNTNLPKTGIEDSIPVAMLVMVFGISAIYAYKKIKEYRNI